MRIQDGILSLERRCLYTAANWLSILDLHSPDYPTSNTQPPPPIEDCLDESEWKAVRAAKTSMDLREYAQVGHLLNSKCQSSLSVFLRYYAHMLDVERKYQHANTNLIFDGMQTSTQSFANYQSELASLLKQVSIYSKIADPLGILVQKVNNATSLAVSYLVTSINAFNMNWSAWMELLVHVKTEQDFQAVLPQLPKCPAYSFFMLQFSVNFLHDNQATLQLLNSVKTTYPSHPSILLLHATLYHHRREFEYAKSLFEEYFESYPASIDGSDTYSNVLYLMGDCASLSILAQRCSNINKYSPETCIVVANYYGLKGKHEKAIMYYKRALKLNAKCMAAWTLMGHEYLEIGNTKAALESYRRAVDFDPRDYRAWFGLGQTYEILGLFSFALLYYQKAIATRPYDSRIWSALGTVYECLDLKHDSDLCKEKAKMYSKQEDEDSF